MNLTKTDIKSLPAVSYGIPLLLLSGCG